MTLFAIFKRIELLVKFTEFVILTDFQILFIFRLKSNVVIHLVPA